ncbi:NucA/NucB deoxyribonuclease domain-containing protein [Streptomyces sp. 8N616]|uniref:NucA/NucB deoxyribonuclease domain-containing protein n=1 Tax=Streptomyces sp. 8N616 TaxID=3457414 RepID=UPI003FD0B3AA
MAGVIGALLSSGASAAPQGNERTVVTITETDGLGGPEKKNRPAGQAPFSDSVKERKNRTPKDTTAEYKERLKLLTKKDSSDSDGMSTQLMTTETTSAAGYRATITDCQTLSLAERPGGFAIDHFSWCKLGYYKLKKELCNDSGCKTVAEANLRASTVGNGNNGVREITYVTQLDQIQIVTGDAATMVVQAGMNCTTYGSAVCTADTFNGRTDTLAGWMNFPTVHFKYTSPEPGTTLGGTDQISLYDFDGYLQLVGGNKLENGRNGFRCDSATYIPSAAKGCVFDLTTELWYDLAVNNPEVDATAKHIDDAQYRPEMTFPSWTGKTVPGAITSGETLNRVYHDQALRDANRRKAVSTCKTYYGADYATYGQDCDEYPFSSTLQGAASGNDRYSARALPSADNQKAGSLLSQWYSNQRIIDNDPFYVFIQGGSGFPI